MAGIFVKKCPCLRPKIEEETKVLDYRHSSLQDVPSEVFNVERTLEELYTDSNQIRDLPRELFYCHGLRKLSISDNEITSIPPAISSLANLEELDFSKNGVIDVPDTIKGCKYLRSIDASVNPLGKLPEGFTQLANLTHLYLNDTFMDYLPGSFGRMVKLKILEMRENHLKTLPRSFSRLVELERLDIGNNEFTELSDVIGGLTNLLELWCDHNQITTVTHSIGNLKQLMFLDASKNRLQELPGELEGCTSMADLHLTSNNLLSLPESIGNLNNLTTLKVDDNQLTYLPKTLGGLSSLSELNVSTNDLEDLPASIGLLRNLRTFYADENLLKFIPAELGSCSGITVLSLRSNKLTYIPDELGRIPRLRVLNLSNNLLLYLPFTIVKLKELQALWLTENQTRPLIPLQSEYEEDTGRKILTCYLLPQGELQANDERDLTGDNQSFHESMWDEERLRRQQIHFDFIDNSDEEGTLVRCPTPYPKEMREKVRHARNLAMRQMINVPDGNGNAGAAAKPDNLDLSSRDSGNGKEFGFDYTKLPDHSDVRVREARITKPTSPTLQESHRLYRYDKEKLLKDKARMQHRLSVPEIDNDTKALIKEDHNKRGKDDLSRHSGSVPDLSQEKPNRSTSPSTQFTYDDLYQRQLLSQHRGRRSRRIREYDSDTGYRSDVDIEVHLGNRKGKKGDSETLSVRSQPLPFSSHQRHRRKDDMSFYGNDLEAHGAGAYGTSNAVVAAYQRKISQHSQSSYHSHQSNYSPLSSSKSPHNNRPSSPTKSEPRNYHYVGDSESFSHSNPWNRSLNSKNSRTAKDDFYTFRQSGSNNYPSTSNQLNSKSKPQIASTYHHSNDPMRQTPVHNGSHSSLLSNGQGQPGSPSQPRPRESSRPPPAVAPKPSAGNLTGSNLSLSHPSSSSPLLPVFHRDNFLDQSTPVVTNAPVILSSNSHGHPLDREGGGSSYSLTEEKPNAQRFTTKANVSQGSDMATPPPYPSAPPYRRQGDNTPSNTHAGSCRSGSDSSSHRTDSPRNPSSHRTDSPRNPSSHRTDSPRASAISSLINPSSTSSSPLNLNRSRSSPCGFHGNNPFSDLPSNAREKLSFGDYADIDRLSQGIGVTRDNHTTRSGSSSSHIGSASQIGVTYNNNNNHRTGVIRSVNRDCSDSSDSRSDIHNHSSSRESPHPAHHYGASSKHGNSFDPYPGNFDSGHLEDLAMTPNQEQSSQVSSSTDSGYGHGHHVYERIGDFSNHQFLADNVNGKNASGAASNPNSKRPTPMKRLANSTGRAVTPRNDSTPDTTSQDHRDEFRVTIKKNPGLGFSIAGGIGSLGNPFRVTDPGIFVTKVTQDGPASQILRPGDKIIEVNNVDFQAIHHHQAVSILKNNSCVTLLVERIQKVNMV